MVARSSGETAPAVAGALRAPASSFARPSDSISDMRTASPPSTASITTSFSSAVCSRIERTFCNCASLERKQRARRNRAECMQSVRSERGIDRDRHRAEQQGSEVRNHPLRPVLAENGNPVALDRCPTSAARPTPPHPLATTSPKKSGPTHPPRRCNITLGCRRSTTAKKTSLSVRKLIRKKGMVYEKNVLVPQALSKPAEV